MIQLNIDINIPNGCNYCPLQDEEFHYCHGRLCSSAWECEEYSEERPFWRPLKEIKDEM